MRKTNRLLLGPHNKAGGGERVEYRRQSHQSEHLLEADEVDVHRVVDPFDRADEEQAAQTDQSQSHLLQLPAELRNQIWEYAVVNAEHIVAKFTGRYVDVRKLQRSILRTCRQTRKEASPFFFQQNRVIVYTHNFALEPQPNHWFWIEGDKHEEHVGLEVVGDPLWRNMINWLRRVQDGEMAIPTSKIEDVEVMEICTSVFHMSKLLRGLPWRIANRASDGYAGVIMQAQRMNASMSSAWGFRDDN